MKIFETWKIIENGTKMPKNCFTKVRKDPKNSKNNRCEKVTLCNRQWVTSMVTLVLDNDNISFLSLIWFPLSERFDLPFYNQITLEIRCTTVYRTVLFDFFLFCKTSFDNRFKKVCKGKESLVQLSILRLHRSWIMCRQDSAHVRHVTI